MLHEADRCDPVLVCLPWNLSQICIQTEAIRARAFRICPSSLLASTACCRCLGISLRWHKVTVTSFQHRNLACHGTSFSPKKCCLMNRASKHASCCPEFLACQNLENLLANHLSTSGGVTAAPRGCAVAERITCIPAATENGERPLYDECTAVIQQFSGVPPLYSNG